METRSAGNIPTREINPKYAFSAGRTWAFGAFAELIDNACDPNVNAGHQWIDWTRIKDTDCLTFTDDGAGLPYETLLEMMSGKKTIQGHAPVGQYGNGFKSGSMRLGKDVIVFSKTRDTMSVGLLSKTYRKTNRDKRKVVPIVILRKEGDTQVVPDHEDSLKAILEYSLFKTEEELQRELQAINTTSSGGSTGTRIIIWNLRSSHVEVEFDFETDPYDIRIPEGAEMDLEPECSYSLREKPITIIFGYNEENQNSGMLLYYKKRLIKAYERVGCQRQGVEIVGIAECDSLEPTDNKQDFEATERYRNFKKSLAEKLKKYWFATIHLRDTKDPSRTSALEDEERSAKQKWVQCDSCHKWRKLLDGIDANKLPERWFCFQNPDPNFRTCTANQESEDSMDEELFTETILLDSEELEPIPADYGEETQQQEEDRQQTAEDGASTPSTAATPSSPGDCGSELPQEGTSSPPCSRSGNNRSGVRHREPSAHATPRSKRPLLSTPRSTRAKRAKASLLTYHEESIASCPTVSYVAPDDQIMDDAGAPVVQTEVAAPISVQERDQQLSDSAVPEEPMEPSTRATAADPASAVQQSVSVDTQTERAAPQKEEPSEDQPKSLEQTQRQREAANGGERPLLELAAKEQNFLLKQWEMAMEERDRCRQQLEEAKQERDQNRGQIEAANQERDQYRTQLEAAKQEGDQYKRQIVVANQMRKWNWGQMVAANKERDQYRLQLEAAKQERDQHRDQLETVMKERDQCKQQMKAAIEERDQHKCLLEAAIQEKDQYKDQAETANLERDRYRGQAETANLERDRYRGQAETANLERDRYRGQAETATLDRDQYRNQVETANRVKDQYNKQLGATNQEIDRYKGQAEVANLERDQYREQAKIASRERDQFMDQVETVTREREQYIANLNQIKRALGQMRPGEVRQESCDQVPKGEDSLTMTWDSVLEDLNCCRGEMVQLKSKCEEQRRELEDLRGAGSSIVSPRPAQSTGAGPSQPGSSEAERLKGLRVTVSRLLPILIPGLELDQDQVNYENTVIDEILEQYVDGATCSGAR